MFSTAAKWAGDKRTIIDVMHVHKKIEPGSRTPPVQRSFSQATSLLPNVFHGYPKSATTPDRGFQIGISLNSPIPFIPVSVEREGCAPSPPPPNPGTQSPQTKGGFSRLGEDDVHIGCGDAFDALMRAKQWFRFELNVVGWRGLPLYSITRALDPPTRVILLVIVAHNPPTETFKFESGTASLAPARWTLGLVNQAVR